MYKRILCLLGHGVDAEQVLQRACQARDEFGAELFLLSVVEFVPVSGAEDAMLSTPLALADEMERRASERMNGFAAKAGISTGSARVVQGDLAAETCRCAEEWGIDLVVLGKHERHGLSSWFDHSEDEVLHGCPCDLLAVHLPTQG